jgi:RHS repeat-associated protein
VRPFSPEEIAYYQCDHLGTPLEMTDHEGRVAWAAHYKAWGEAEQTISAAARKAGVRNPIRFQGQYLDEETGLHYNRHRYYDPGSGRYVSSDPLGLPGGLNAYGYVRNNPVQRVDPWGLVDINLVPPGEWLHDEVEKLPSSPKTITVAGHADSERMYGPRDQIIRPHNLAEKIQKLPNYSKDKTVILYACEAGKGENCFASRLAKCLGGNRVLAAEESVWPEGGRPVIAPARADDENEPDMSKRRKFRVF